jgi:phage gp36-like protein
MPTPYIDRPALELLLGVETVAKAEKTLAANVAAVISGACATADGYVLQQLGELPPSSVAIEQVAPLVAELALSRLYAGASNELIAKRGEAAMRALRDVASGAFRLHRDPVEDDPSTPEDESALGAAAAGSGSRVLSNWGATYDGGGW